MDPEQESYQEWLEAAKKYQAEKGYKLLAKDGDQIEFLFLRWDEHWEFDFPTVMAAPAYQYNPNGEDPESWLEDILVDLGTMGYIHDDTRDTREEEWRQWPKPQRFRSIIRERLRGKNTWVKWDAIAHRFLVKFTWNEENGWLDAEVLEHEEA